jgi:hypothetical protein
MFDATDNDPTADEIIAAVTALSAERDALLAEREELVRLLEEAPAPKDDLLVYAMDDVPGGRPWVFIEDGKLLAISSDLDEATRFKLLAQVEPPRLTTCETCRAPMYAGTACQMH